MSLKWWELDSETLAGLVDDDDPMQFRPGLPSMPTQAGPEAQVAAEDIGAGSSESPFW